MAEEIYTVVVADDEQELREAVCNMIHWEEIGFRLVGSAGNGLDALQLVEQLQPDLLLTDIQMPFITGTELAKSVRELQPLISIAFLSGYDDFEYAQRAIETRVISYLLKPISVAELTLALREIHAKMEQHFLELRPVDVHVSRHLTTASLLLDPYAEYSGEEAEAQLLESGMVFTSPYGIAVFCLGVRQAEQRSAYMVDRVLRKYFSCCSFASGGRILSLVISEDGFAHLGAALDELYTVCRRMLDENCVLGISRIYSSLGFCSEACREAVETQQKAIEPGIFRYEDLLASADAAVSGSAVNPARDGVRALCQQAMKIIASEYQNDSLSLSSVSEQLHVNPNYLSANMKKYAGDTFINLLIRERMEHALQMLQQSGSVKIADVAAACGYTDQHYFSYCFKKYHGISPVKMRRAEDSV
ncbi:MAG: response regulator [Oscillospiraceae bacterium]|nr:response regulator [Oscillospiraceae bacterium]